MRRTDLDVLILHLLGFERDPDLLRVRAEGVAEEGEGLGWECWAAVRAARPDARVEWGLVIVVVVSVGWIWGVVSSSSMVVVGGGGGGGEEGVGWWAVWSGVLIGCLPLGLCGSVVLRQVEEEAWCTRPNKWTQAWCLNDDGYSLEMGREWCGSSNTCRVSQTAWLYRLNVSFSEE